MLKLSEQLAFRQMDDVSHQSRRSPLRYPGGKFYLSDSVRRFIPTGLQQMCSPFVGGASIELRCAADGIRVEAGDVFEPLANFWQYVLDDAAVVADVAQQYCPLSYDAFYALQRGYKGESDTLAQAAVFFVLNRSSFNASTFQGGMSPGHPRWNDAAVERLRTFRSDNLSVRCCDFETLLQQHPTDFVYCDPPYVTDRSDLYGYTGELHRNFEHERLAEVLRERRGWILSYRYHPYILKLYDGYRVVTLEPINSMSRKAKPPDVLIVDLD